MKGGEAQRFDAQGWLGGVRQAPSPHCDARPAGSEVELLVVHGISLPPGRFGGPYIEDLFLGRLDAHAHPYFRKIEGLRVSAHFLVRRRGELLQFVGTEARAWHAGVSRFGERERCNDFSIGVELEGTGEIPFTAAQYRRLAWLATALARRHPLRWVAGHSDIAPGRKSDPGVWFDWPRFLADVRPTGLSRPFVAIVPVAAASTA